MIRTATVVLDTNLGSFRFRADGASPPGSASQLLLRVTELEPSVFPDLAVRWLRAVVLQASSDQGFDSSAYSSCFGGDVPCAPRSGQFLDAQIWTGSDQIVVVGTEDGEMLTSRVPTLFAAGASLANVQYRANGMSVSLARVPAGRPVTLHYLVAENGKSESEQYAAWAAVSLPHEQVLARVRRC